MIIYRITNKLNNKIYIGQTIYTLDIRWKKHLWNVKHRKNVYLYNAINHYGPENFLIEEIEKCTNINELNQRETYWIQYYKSNQKEFGYNMTTGGDNRTLNPELVAKIAKTRRDKNQHLSVEHKQAISNFNKGKILSKITRQKISTALIGKKVSDETRKKISDAQKGKLPFFKDHHHTSETKLKLSQYRTGKSYIEMFGEDRAEALCKKRRERWTKENNPNFIDVDKNTLYQLIKDGYNNQYIATFFSVSRATIISKTKQYFNKTPTQLRIEFFNSVNPLTKKKEYKEISLQKIINLILLNNNREQICNILNISGWLLNKRLIKAYNIRFQAFRKKVLSGEIINETSCNDSKNTSN
jgi:group I intron endonuclease